MAVAKRLVGRFAYPVVNAATALLTRGWRVGVEVDGRELTDGARALAVAVGNAPVLGNGTEVWPGACPDDGRLDVVVAHAGARPARLALGLAVARARPAQRRRRAVRAEPPPTGPGHSPGGS